MRGIVRPCRTHLGKELHARWQAHLCGLCLTLRDEAGQPERALTGYDVLLLSVLVEAQAGRLETAQAGPCPLRAFRPATVVARASSGAQLAAAGALLAGGAGLDDTLTDGEVPRAARPVVQATSVRLVRRGRALAQAVGLDADAVLDAPRHARAAELRGGTLDQLLAPSGAAVAALFSATATVAGVPANAAALADAGDAFGRLVHLLDAVEDVADDGRAGRFNPLSATGTEPAQAHRLARALVQRVADALGRCALVDGALVEVLLGRELRAAVHRAFPEPVVPAQRAAGSLLAVWALMAQAVIIGGWGSSGGGCGSRRRRRGHGYDPYGRGYAVRSVGPSCGQLLACNCCLNAACNGCCCGGDCADV